MELSDVAPSLRERLGPEASVGLLALFTTVRQEWTTEVTTAAVERFERRLSEELSEVRKEFRADTSAVRQDFGELRLEFAELRLELRTSMSDLRQELHSSISDLRQELRSSLSSFREEFRSGLSSLRQEHQTSKFELIKWCFVFWVGQAIAVAGIVGVMLRFVVP